MEDAYQSMKSNHSLEVQLTIKPSWEKKVNILLLLQVGSVTPSGILLSQGGLPENCTADQFHFHWGEVDDKGSEHTIDGKSYPLEVIIIDTRSGTFFSIWIKI